MSAFDLGKSIARAAQRVPANERRTRRDRGESRLDARIEALLTKLLSTTERPSFSEVARQVTDFCHREGLRPPSRSSVYNTVVRVKAPGYAWSELPREVQQALYNLSPEAPAQPGEDYEVPGDHLAFYAFNHGAPRALSFASGLPWVCLWQALRRPGWRPKSRSLLAAVAKQRGI